MAREEQNHIKWILFVLALPLAVHGQLIHGFSITPDKQVLFAPGNLQYNAAMGEHLCADGTVQQGTWRFAEHQWDYSGVETRHYSPTYNGWIDLFAWGTSGWNSGANKYQPWSHTSENSDYYVGGNENNSLTGNYKNADWAVYNTIGDDPPGTWRTLTCDEWKYLFAERNNASNLCGKATIEDVHGLIFLPDDYYTNASLLPSFVSGTNREGFGANIYTLSEWEMMEAVGAVFLPAAGVSGIGAGECGFYWSISRITPQGMSDIGQLQLSKEKNLTLVNTAYRFGLISVRPVWDIPENYIPTINVDTTVCDTLLPLKWRGHEWQSDGVIRDTLQSVRGTDSICLQLSLSTEICCPDVQTVSRDTTVCALLLPFTWYLDGHLFVFEQAETREFSVPHGKWENCTGKTYILRLDTVYCERLYDIIVNKYNWQLLCNNELVRELFPEQTPTDYLWYKDGSAIPNATEDEYSERNELQGAFQLRLHMNDGSYVWSEILTVQPAQTQTPSRIRIYNHNGLLIYQSEGETDIPSLPRGLYIIEIEQNGEQRIEKKLRTDFFP